MYEDYWLNLNFYSDLNRVYIKLPLPDTTSTPQPGGPDFHSYANSADVRVKHIDLDWQVLFAQKVLKGTAILTVERVSQNRQAPLVLDTKNLNIEKVTTSIDGKTYSPGTFTLPGKTRYLDQR